MPTSHTSWTRLWNTLRRSSRPHISWSSAIWRGAIVGICVTVGAVSGHLEYGASVGFGALGPAMLPATLGKRDILRISAMLTLLVPVLGLLATLAADSWWLVILTPLCAYVFGTIANIGPASAMLSLPCLGTAIALSATQVSFGTALHSFMFLILGSLIGGAIALLSWNLERESELRKMIYRSLLTLRDIALDEDPAGTRTLISAAAVSNAEVTLSQIQLPVNTHKYLGNVLGAGHQVRLAMSAWILSNPAVEDRQKVAAAITKLATSFRIHRDEYSPEPIGTQTLDDTLTELSNAIADHATTRFDLPTANDLSTATWIRSMTALLKPGNSASAQGARLAIAVALSTIVWLISGLGHGYWITMTVAMILKSDYVTTVAKGVLRIGGTIASVLLLAVVLAIFGDSSLTYCILLIVAVPFMIHWIMANYFFASLAIASTMLLLSEAADPSFMPASERLVNTVIGCVIAVVVYLVLPAWRGSQLPNALQDAAQCTRDWIGATFHLARNQTPQARQQVRQHATSTRLAVVAAIPIVDAALIEPKKTRSNPGQGLAILIALERVAMATLALEIETTNRLTEVDHSTEDDKQDRTLSNLDSVIQTLRAPAQPPAPAEVFDGVPGVSGDTILDRLLNESTDLRTQTTTFWN